MGKVPADTDAFVETFIGGAGVAGVLVSEGDVVVHEIANGLDAGMAAEDRVELAPGKIHQFFGFAVARAEEELQAVVREFVDDVLDGGGVVLVDGAGVGDQGVSSEAEFAGGGDEAGAPVAEDVAVLDDVGEGGGDEVVGDEDMGHPGIVDVEHEEHRRRLRVGEDDVIAEADFHDVGFSREHDMCGGEGLLHSQNY